MRNRAEYIVLQGLPSGNLGILNTNAPNDTAQTTQLWEKMITSLPSSCHWIFLGDFNFVESRSDKTNACSRLVPMAEQMVFVALKATLQMDEPFRSVDSLRFLWDNYCVDGSRVLARLDKIYIFSQSLATNRQTLSYQVRGYWLKRPSTC